MDPQLISRCFLAVAILLAPIEFFTGILGFLWTGSGTFSWLFFGGLALQGAIVLLWFWKQAATVWLSAMCMLIVWATLTGSNIHNCGQENCGVVSVIHLGFSMGLNPAVLSCVTSFVCLYLAWLIGQWPRSLPVQERVQ